MRSYEIMFIVRPNMDKAEIKKTAEDFKKEVLDTKASDIKLEEMGQKELAYKVKGFNNGYYYLLTFNTENVSSIKNFDRYLSLSENVIRHLIVKVGE